MAVSIELNNVGSGYNTAKINENFELIEAAFADALSRSGTSPNQLEADLDMNGFELLNVSNVLADGVSINLSWKGDWATSTDYVINDLVYSGNSAYICLVAHTSTVFGDDLNTNGYWQLFAAGGDGTGDLLAANNLSDLSNAATARINLGLEIGEDVQAYNSVLDGITAAYTTEEATKLSGIETGATADQSDAEIKTAYENNADTNAFTDSEQTKLAGIEASADVTDASNVGTAIVAASAKTTPVAADQFALIDSEDSDALKPVTFANLQGSINVSESQVTDLQAYLVNVSEDTTPQLGGNLDVNGNTIVSTSNGNISLVPNGTGQVVLDGINYPKTDGTSGQFLSTDGSGNLTFSTASGTGDMISTNNLSDVSSIATAVANLGLANAFTNFKVSTITTTSTHTYDTDCVHAFVAFCAAGGGTDSLSSVGSGGQVKLRLGGNAGGCFLLSVPVDAQSITAFDATVGAGVSGSDGGNSSYDDTSYGGGTVLVAEGGISNPSTGNTAAYAFRTADLGDDNTVTSTGTGVVVILNRRQEPAGPVMGFGNDLTGSNNEEATMVLRGGSNWFGLGGKAVGGNSSGSIVVDPDTGTGYGAGSGGAFIRNNTSSSTTTAAGLDGFFLVIEALRS